jgi:hypothetical protein
MCDDGDFEGSEILIAEPPLLHFCLGKAEFVELEYMVEEGDLFWPKEIVSVECKFIEAVFCEVHAWDKGRRLCWKRKEREQGIDWDASNSAEIFRQGGWNRSYFPGDFFVCKCKGGWLDGHGASMLEQLVSSREAEGGENICVRCSWLAGS